MPKFSIIVAAYNAGHYIHRLFQSIENQNFRDFEVIVVNDGSTDNTVSICNEIQSRDQRFKVFNKPNGGVSSARNLGIQHARGEYLIFWDADDYVPNNTLEVFAKAIDQYNSDIIIGQYQEILSDGTIINRTTPLPKDTLFDNIYITQSILRYALTPNSFFGSCWVKTFRRKVFTQHSIRFPNRRRAEDWMVNIEFLRHAQSAVAINDIVYYYVRNDQSAMSKPFPEQTQLWEETMQIKRSLINDFNYNTDYNKITLTFIDEVFEHLIKIANYYGLNGHSQALDVLNSHLIRNACMTDCVQEELPIRTRFFKVLVKRNHLSSAYLFVIIWLSLNRIKQIFKR